MHLLYCAAPSVYTCSDAGLHTLLRAIGRLVALLHDGGLIHGDLTTSNMLLRAPDNELVRIEAIPENRSTTNTCVAGILLNMPVLAANQKEEELSFAHSIKVIFSALPHHR